MKFNILFWAVGPLNLDFYNLTGIWIGTAIILILVVFILAERKATRKPTVIE